jgi:hypothetical protein
MEKKSEMVFLFLVMPQNSPTLWAEGGEFDTLFEVVWLHNDPLIDGEFTLTQSPVGERESTQTPTHPFASMITITFC